MNYRSALTLTTLTIFAVAAAPTAHAQLRSVKADVTATVPEGQTFRAGAGGTGTVVLRVKLPEGVHVQSDKPLDKSLIPTVLTLEPRPGVRVEKIVYPAATTLKQEGQKQPLAVFGHDFTITVHLALTTDVAAGDLVLPARLRYQACDESMCYPPARVDTAWTLHIDSHTPR